MGHMVTRFKFLGDCQLFLQSNCTIVYSLGASWVGSSEPPRSGGPLLCLEGLKEEGHIEECGWDISSIHS